jgi:hypothetical protein
MKTCLVWDTTDNPKVDYALASVYNIPELFKDPA